MITDLKQEIISEVTWDAVCFNDGKTKIAIPYSDGNRDRALRVLQVAIDEINNSALRK